MSHHLFNKRFALALLFSVGVLATAKLFADDTQSRKPNIILIYADDLGWSDVGYNGAEHYETPNIDRLAKEGMVFHRFYPGAANCAPSRATMLTGTYTPRHGVYVPQGLSRGGAITNMRWKVPTRDADLSFNTFPVSINHVDPAYESLAELLARAGYVSARLGKWHIGDDNQGFTVNSANGEKEFITNKQGTEKRFYQDRHVAEKLTDAGLDFIRQNKEKPFFLYIAHWEVHTPMAARKERIQYYRNKYKKSGLTHVDPVYAAETEQVDISVGRILQCLKEHKLEKDTVVIFTSDNGGVSDLTSNAPLRAGKGTFYEGGIRTPFCIRWPGKIAPNSSSDIAINGVDMLPTFADLADVSLPTNQPVDGKSIVPILLNIHFDRERAMFFHFPLYLGGGGVDQVLPTYRGQPNYWRAVPCSVILKGDWKLIRYYEYDRFELYNLREDISESKDRSKTRPDKAQELLTQLNRWVKEVKAPVPSIRNE